MGVIEGMLQELEHEAQTTRKVLERLPEENFDWKPHPKSMSIRELGSHVATICEWTAPTLDQDEFDMPAEYKPWMAGSKEALLQKFEESVEQAGQSMQGYPDKKLFQDWTLRSGEQVYFTMPRMAVLRGFVLNHLVHHRGQLSVYLRLNDLPVPAIYGPSADEQS